MHGVKLFTGAAVSVLLMALAGPAPALADTIEAGRQKFQGHCAMCHETQYANRAVFPDLRYSPMINTPEGFSAVVLEGLLQANGMASFKERLTAEEAQSIRAYIIERANQLKSAPPGQRR